MIFKYEHNRHHAFNVRALVFMVEQGFSYDFDELDDDPEVVYITAYSDSDPVRPIGTARIFPAHKELQFPDDLEYETGDWIIGRIAVLPDARHMGLGSKLLEEAERYAAEQGAGSMHLHAQVRAMPFYHANGYKEYGAHADDEGVPHQWMRKKLGSPRPIH